MAVIEGEDASPEAMRPSVEVVDALGLGIEWLHPPVGQRGLDEYGAAFPPEARAEIDRADTTWFGSTSGASGAALFYLRWGKQTYANVRPSRFRPGFQSPLRHPEEIDLVIVRENLEDLYLFLEGDVADLAPLGLTSPTARCDVADLAPGRYALKVITEAGSDRVARFSFELARKRKALGGMGRVTCGTKHNMLPQSDGLFRERVERMGGAYPDIELQCFIVDDFAHRLVAAPHELDVVVLPNLYGDVLSDAAAALVGGLGLAPSGCFGDDYAYFESAHGTAPDIAGRNVINPTATLLSAVMMLEHLGCGEGARR
ncbi:MAG: isocitrate/isopropylmalate family dehydrogenase, partial [Proteobacteria bacterium]|nr:isocitrate/isopropylmalate family dehydrogenase [Pseudomonadota bacterium]